MKNRPRSLAVCKSHKNCPQIWLRGAWFFDYGFDIGDQTEITNPEPGTMVIRVKTPAALMNRFRYKRLLEERMRQLKASEVLTQAELEKLRSLEAGLKAA